MSRVFGIAATFKETNALVHLTDIIGRNANFVNENREHFQSVIQSLTLFLSAHQTIEALMEWEGGVEVWSRRFVVRDLGIRGLGFVVCGLWFEVVWLGA